MQSQWIPLFTSTLSLESYRSATYIPAGSCCRLVSGIKPSEDEIDHYEVVASLTNIDNKIYLVSKFLLPSAAPEHPLSRYSTSWDEFDREYKVSLRQPVPRVLFPLVPTYAIVEAADDACLAHDGSSSVEDTPTSPLADEPDTPMSIEYENCAPTFTPANDLDLPESPVKAHLLERPGAPTPGRGRTQYVINEDSDEEENHSYVAGEDSGMDDVFGDGEASHTCDGSYVLPPPELVTPALSSTTTDSLVHGSIDAPDDMATLSAHVGQDSTTGTAQSSSAQQKSDIDLDEVFGQDATEFYEDEEDIVMSYASDLLARRTQGLLLSKFIPTGRKAYEALRAAFQFKEWTYDLRHAGLAAAEVAYYFSSEGLDSLRDNGFATRQYPMESERSIEWKSRQRDVAALTPYDPRSCKAEMLRYAVRKPERSIVSQVDPSSQHYNFLGQTVDTRSKTPATVSFLIQLSACVKPYRYEFSRVGVMLSQANKYIDAVVYEGPPELLSYRGTALQEQKTGYVSKLNDCKGSFGDLFDGDTIIKNFQDISDHFLANGWHVNMQRPYIMDYEEEAHRGDRDLVLNESAPREFFRTRNAQGVIEHWGLCGTAKPKYRQSQLWKAHSVDDSDRDGPLGLFGAKSATGGRCEGSRIVEEAEAATEPSSSGDSSSEQDSDEEKQQLSRPATPPSPISPVVDHFPPSFDNVYCSKLAFVDTPLCAPEPKRLEGAIKTTNTINFGSIYSPALSFSKVVPMIDTPPCISGATEPKPEQPTKCDEQPPTQLNPPSPTNPPPTPAEEGENGLSHYAFGYGVLMFSIGIVLSMW